MPEKLEDKPGFKVGTVPSANDIQVGGNHYQGGKIQHWDWAAQLPYLEGNATKYISRHTKKNGLQDLLKAEHYLHKMMEVYYAKEYANHVATQGRVAALKLLGLTEEDMLHFAAKEKAK